jgi:hypothetical protein
MFDLMLNLILNRLIYVGMWTPNKNLENSIIVVIWFVYPKHPKTVKTKQKSGKSKQ